MTSRRTRSLAQMAALAALVGLLSGCDKGPFQALQPLHEATRTINVPHQGEAVMEVNTLNGSVVVSQNDRDDVHNVAHLRAVSPERLETAEVVADRDESGALSVSVDWPEGKPRTREGCSCEVLIPDAVDVTLRTTNGGIDLAGLGGKADLHTSNGAVEVKGHNGPLNATTSNGQIKATGIRGPIDVSTSNGRIEIAEASSRVDAKTSNGAIAVSLAPEGPGPIDARTSNGSITLNLSPAMQGRLTLTTSNGSVRVDPSCEAQVVSERKNHAVLDLGSSENHSSATTSNGSIQVKRAKDISQ
jgi:DUF4097 and DUF4098 domain-containing protein YvlB